MFEEWHYIVICTSHKVKDAWCTIKIIHIIHVFLFKSPSLEPYGDSSLLYWYIHFTSSSSQPHHYGRLTLAQFMEGFNNLTKAVSGRLHGDSWIFRRFFVGQENSLPQYCLELLEVSLYGLFLNKWRYLCFFHGMIVFSSNLYVVCVLHFKGYHLPGSFPIPPLFQFVTSETLGGNLWYTSIRYFLFWSRCDLTKLGDYEIRGLIGSLVGWLVCVDISWWILDEGVRKWELASNYLNCGWKG